ncbi:MAG: 16S rRNA (uracil(1498)-N(3))-methyltransferase [Bacteroidia bacterium]|nr:16S rRNA (uracil(1498)-N(3))-methyltransferase [Bacteroidia bacterium]
MLLHYQPNIDLGTLSLSEDESRHAAKVLRVKNGDILDLTDGKGNFYKIRITKSDPRKCIFEIQEKKSQPKRSFFIHLAIAPTKNTDRIEWFVEKCVEIGVDKISFIVCQNSERRSINRDRIEKIAISAMKQSGQYWLPEIVDCGPVLEILKESSSQKFIAYVDQSNPHHLKSLAKPNQDYLVLIGPEGDFNKEELLSAEQAGFSKVSLGTTRLRTETAGVAACHILNLVNQ